eukprot:484457_1
MITVQTMILTIVCAILLNSVDSQTAYNGPASDEYFQSFFVNNVDIASLPAMQCNGHYNGTTDPSFPISYYRINISNEIKTKYYGIKISTCCPDEVTFNRNMGNIESWFCVHHGSTVTCYYTYFDATLYSRTCDNASLDTILYLLYQKKGQINLLSIVDDTDQSLCDNTDKSLINLLEYSMGEYIIGIGGYGQEYGRYYVNFLCNGISSQYNGPESNEYFHSLSAPAFSNLTELHCGVSYTGTTNASNPVYYYKIDITASLKNQYKSLLQVTSCCHDLKTVNKAAGNVQSVSGSNYQYWVDENEVYDKYCSNTSLDTALYLLYEKRGQLNLLETSDDGCINMNMTRMTHKSTLNLMVYDETEYIIGIGGYAQEYGSFFIHMICEQYSWPVQEEELDPISNNPSTLSCNNISSGNFTGGNHMLYYELEITQNTFFPIIIAVCSDGYFWDIDAMTYISKQKLNSFSYEILNVNKLWFDRYSAFNVFDGTYCDQDNVIGVNWFRFGYFQLDDPNVYQVGTYYVAVHVQEEMNQKLQIKLHCAPPPTAFPTVEPTINPTMRPTEQPTIEPTRSPTLEYSFPIEKSEFHFKNNFPEIHCGETYYGQNTLDKLVSYYHFTVTDNIYPPSYITTCPQNMSSSKNDNYSMHIYDTYLYVVNSEGVVLATEDAAASGCNGQSAEIEITQFESSQYFVVVQGYENKVGEFSISMVCLDPPPKISRELVMSLVFGSCGAAIFLFLVYYMYEWRMYCMRNKLYCCSEKSTQPSSHESHRPIPSMELQPIGMISAGQTTTTNVSMLGHDEHHEINAVNYVCCFCCNKQFCQDAMEHKEETKVEPGDARRIDDDEDFFKQIVENEDAVQTVIAHAIQCCDDQEGMDIYQVLAIRYHDKQSREIRGRKPFAKIGINIEFVAISPFLQTLFIAIIVGLAQTVGITVVIYKLFMAFFAHAITDEFCSMEAKRWNDVYSLKMLSFLLSLIITFYVSVIMGTIQHSGMYEITDKLMSKHIQRIDNVVIWILHIGGGINWYVCLLSVIGSYFIIYESNQGEEQNDGSIDYSHSGLDMILNAVALFFMLELDDVIITAQDYNDCKQHLQNIMNCYTPDISINLEYRTDGEPAFACNCYRDDKSNDIGFQEKVDELNVSNYKNWNSQQCVKWIVSLDDDYEQYADELQEYFTEKGDTGNYLAKLDRTDLVKCGINDFRDVNKIYQEVRITFKNENDKCFKFMIPSLHIMNNIFSVLLCRRVYCTVLYFLLLVIYVIYYVVLCFGLLVSFKQL